MSSDVFPADLPLPVPRTIEQLKTETLERALRHAYPLTGLDPEDVRTALAAIHTLDRDEWAAAWIGVGDRHMARGESLAGRDRVGADTCFLQAWRTYGFGRWPSPNSPGKRQAYERSLAAFHRHTEMHDAPFETLRIPFEGSEIVGYLQLPRDVRPAPVVLAISGLDSRKEDLAERFTRLLDAGIGSLALDSPGTGQAPVRATDTAERMFSRALDALAARPEIDRNRLAVFGGSFGGYWATKLAFVERERLLGVVTQSPGVHETYQFPHLRETLQNTEYLFDLIPAMMTTFENVTTLDELAAARAKLSLVTQGLLAGPSAPMLVIAGARDTQSPISDIELLLRSGTSPKEAWINPAGGHMGRERQGWTDVTIFDRITVPWLKRVLALRC